jgi:IS30 family transposase
MSQEEYNKKSAKKKHLKEKDRYQIEALLKAKKKAREIAEIIGCSKRTIEREIKRGQVTQLTSQYEYVSVYKADVGQRIHEEKTQNKGRPLKIGKDHAYAQRITELICLERYSPDAANAQYRKEHNGQQVVCTRTLYSYIWDGLFYGLEKEDLPRRGKRRTGQRVHHRRVALNNPTGRSIEERTEAINKRQEDGHWEMDTVVGGPGTKACLLVLTERRNNLELIFKLPVKNQASVVHLLDRLERKMGVSRFQEVFKTITCDNGCENLDAAGMEKSVFGKKQRTTVYYAHPYSAYERGANEGANVLIRRFVPKGTDIATLHRSDIKRIAHWMNNYPRRKLEYATAFERSPLAAVLSEACVI